MCYKLSRIGKDIIQKRKRLCEKKPQYHKISNGLGPTYKVKINHKFLDDICHWNI